MKIMQSSIRPALVLLALSLTACLVDRVKIPGEGDGTNSATADMDGSTDSAANGSEGGATNGKEGGNASSNTQGEADAAKLECEAPCSTVAASVCDTTVGDCVRCKRGADCAQLKDTPACNPDVGCVECVFDDNAQKCADKTPVCSNDATPKDTCVECNTASECGSDAPACIGHKCVSCAMTAENVCQGRVNKICEVVSGACVQCTVADESPCAGKSCNPATNTCTSTLLDSVAICEPCVADSECKAFHRCVGMSYEGTKLTPVGSGGGFCLRQLAKGCTEPIAAAKISRASLSGAAAEDYCGVNEAITSCAAILVFGKGCATADGPDMNSDPDPDAGLCAAIGARCETVNGAANKCTYDCTSSLECGSSAPCPVSGADRYCGQ